MPIDTDTPTIRPPSATDMQGGVAPDNTVPTIAPPATRPTYETPTGAFQAEAQAPELTDFASNALQSPSRYDSQLVQDITGQIDAELAHQRQTATNELDEFMSSRGLVGSSVEGELHRGLYGDLERQRMERLNQLNLDAANTFAADRASAADIGFRSGEFARSLGGDRVNEARYAGEFGQGQYEFDTQYGASTALQQRALDLQEQGMEYDEAYRQAQSEIQQEQFAATQAQETEQFESTMTEARAQRLQTLGISEQDFDLRAEEIKNQAELAGRSLDIEEARWQADRDLRVEQLQQEAENANRSFDIQEAQVQVEREQFDASIDLQRYELSQRIDMDGKQYREQVATRLAEYADRQAARVAQMNLQEGTEGFQAEQRALDRILESEALKLQEQGMTNEAAWRQADRELTDKLESAAQRIQKEGITLEDAYRTARGEAEDALARERNAIDQAIQTEALRLQETGLTNEKAMEAARISQAVLEREARYTELAAQRLSDATLQEAANKIQQSGIDKDTAVRQAAIDLERDVQEENRKVTREQMTNAELEFMRADDTERLRIITEGLAEATVEHSDLTYWISKYGGTRGPEDSGDWEEISMRLRELEDAMRGFKSGEGNQSNQSNQNENSENNENTQS
jgi:hypothetical protein